MHWVRVEMQLRNDRALAFISRTDPIGVTFAGVLLNYLRYVEEMPSDANRWRWPMKQYWSDLVGAAEKISLYVKPGIEYNIMQLDNYVFGQAANAIDAALQIHGISGFIFHLNRRETAGNPKYDRLIEQYKHKKIEQKNLR